MSERRRLKSGLSLVYAVSAITRSVELHSAAPEKEVAAERDEVS